MAAPTPAAAAAIPTASASSVRFGMSDLPLPAGTDPARPEETHPYLGDHERHRHVWPYASAVIVRLLVAYDGTRFRGWAAQAGIRTVEGVLTGALGRVLPGEPRLSVAGRADAGVHA